MQLFMALHKEAIEKRLEELQAQARQQETVLFQLSGMIQDCHYWLGEIQKEKANAPDRIDDPEGT
jgi:uncharacterized coiled-coil protein SlyX